MPSQSIQILQHLYLFKEFSARELEQVYSISKLVTYNSGDDIFAEGDEAHSLYVIKHGSVRIQRSVRDSDIGVATLGSSSHFGEIAILDHERRTATATAMERTEILEFEYADLNKLFEANTAMALKFFRAMAHFLGNRLRLTSNDLSFAREKVIKHF